MCTHVPQPCSPRRHQFYSVTRSCHLLLNMSAVVDQVAEQVAEISTTDGESKHLHPVPYPTTTTPSLAPPALSSLQEALDLRLPINQMLLPPPAPLRPPPQMRPART